MKQNPHIIVVAGPTASGKSDFAVELALKHSGEIISADSRQVYKGLDIGTGKITQSAKKGIPHHMLDVVSLDDEFSVATFKALAAPILQDILSRNKTPIICGGTGQYIDALIYDVETPKVGPNHELRKALELKNEDELFAELAEKDPYRADTIDRYNKVRLIRALEIVYELGFVPPLHTPTLLYETEFYLMSPSRELLRTRIEERLQKRLALGMIEEVKNIHDRGFDSEKMKCFGLEYESIAKYLEGKLTEEEMKQDIITKSMQYVKRQETWNKKYLPIAKLFEVQ